MPSLSLVILHVDDPAASAAFYQDLLRQDLLGQAPAEASPSFAMIPLSGDIGLGLWSRRGVQPAATAPGGSELAFAVDDLDAVHAAWAARGLAIAQPPTDMDFGRSFVALDPDGHRLRVFTPAAP